MSKKIKPTSQLHEDMLTVYGEESMAKIIKDFGFPGGELKPKRDFYRIKPLTKCQHKKPKFIFNHTKQAQAQWCSNCGAIRKRGHEGNSFTNQWSQWELTHNEKAR